VPPRTPKPKRIAAISRPETFPPGLARVGNRFAAATALYFRFDLGDNLGHRRWQIEANRTNAFHAAGATIYEHSQTNNPLRQTFIRTRAAGWLRGVRRSAPRRTGWQ
jgi:hypothetical protein